MGALASLHLDRALGGDSDESRGIELMQEAARLSCHQSQWFLAIIYMNGMHGLEKDAVKAMAWTQLSAHGGHPPAVEAEVRMRPVRARFATEEQIQSQIEAFNIESWNPAAEEVTTYSPQQDN